MIDARRVVWLAALAVAVAPGCSAIASRDPGPPPCDFSPPDPDPCPAPSHCLSGFCRTSCTTMMPEVCNGVDDDCNGIVDDDATCATGGVCVEGRCRTDCGAAELCNNRDDDCDGMIDEMLDVDADGDGYVACNVMMPTQSDCNDRDPAIHPGAMELCNGFDDDCNPATTDLSAMCPDTGTLCAVPTGETVPRCIDPRDCTLVPCRAGELCSTNSTCCVMGTAGCGGDCRATHCDPGMRCAPTTSSTNWTCQPLTPLGGACSGDLDCATGHCYTRDSLRLTSGSSGVCGSACCTDADCASFPDSVCWAPGTGARSCLPRSALGSVGLGFQLCTRRDACPGESCVAYSVETPQGSGGAWECAAAANGVSCGIILQSPCASGICEPWTGTDSFCVSPCGSASDCSSSRPACWYLSFHGQWLTGCAPYSGGGQGDHCSTDSDCRDFFCLNNTCADVCCSDATCGAGTCAPVDHSGWEMRCVARAPM